MVARCIGEPSARIVGQGFALVRPPDWRESRSVSAKGLAVKQLISLRCERLNSSHNVIVDHVRLLLLLSFEWFSSTTSRPWISYFHAAKFKIGLARTSTNWVFRLGCSAAQTTQLGLDLIAFGARPDPLFWISKVWGGFSQSTAPG